MIVVVLILIRQRDPAFQKTHLRRVPDLPKRRDQQASPTEECDQMELAMGQGTCWTEEVNTRKLSIFLFSTCAHHGVNIAEHHRHMVITNTFMICMRCIRKQDGNVGFSLLLLLVSLRS